ncbi:hypothetical protein EMIT079MI2_160020 [Bacillus sp. IT-79MI2]
MLHEISCVSINLDTCGHITIKKLVKRDIQRNTSFIYCFFGKAS